MTGVSHLYIHLPFCDTRCGYCDFYSETGSRGRMAEYVAALLVELKESACGGCGGAVSELATVYLGGGTPTLVGGELIGRLLAGVRKAVGVAGGAEITVEANPVTIDASLAGQLMSAGVNRISLGVQSFNRQLRRNLERAGGAEAVQSAVSELRAAGMKNLGLDLIFGIPGQRVDDLERDIEAALAMRPQHISWYELTVKEGSAYQMRWAGELAAKEDEGTGATYYRRVADALEAAGYRWYETSNFALPGYECRHNLAYWEGEDYLGLGAGAWSTVGLKRWRNVESVGDYIQAIESGALRPARAAEALSPADKIRERLMLGLRIDTGVSAELVTSTIDPEQLKNLQRDGFLTTEGGRISLTRAGRFVANDVCARLLTP